MNSIHKIKRNMKNKMLRSVVAFLILVSIAVNSVPVVNAASYTDVPSSHWAYDAIEYVTINGYMNGVGNNTFNPDGVLSRAQVITALSRVSDKKDHAYYEPYSDVAQGAYYYDAVCWAYYYSLSQIIQTSSTLFLPNNAVTRVKMAELIWKFAQENGWTYGAAPSISLPYTDIGSLTTAQVEALRWCYYYSIMIGVSNTTFSPYSTISRAQLAKILYNLDRAVAQNKAFCVGTDYGDGVDTSSAAAYASTKYESLDYSVTCVTVPRVNTMRNYHYKKSNILFFDGHGNYDHISFNFLQTGGDYRTGVYYSTDFNSSTGYKYVGIIGNMDFVNLAVFGACNTALGNDNIAKRACENGALVTIGWTDEIRSSSFENWLLRFNNYLAQGSSISDAVSYADSFFYVPGSHVKDHVMYIREPWGGNLALSNNNSLLSNDTTIETTRAETDIMEEKEKISIMGKNVIDEVAAIIHDYDNHFEKEKYRINKHCSGDELITIDYMEEIEGFETNSGYIAIIKGNKLVSLFDYKKEIPDQARTRLCNLSNQLGITSRFDEENTKPTHIIKPDKEDYSEELKQALQLALERTQSSPKKDAVKQRYHYYYDVEDNNASILVYTDYYYDNTNGMGVDFFQFNLED